MNLKSPQFHIDANPEEYGLVKIVEKKRRYAHTFLKVNQLKKGEVPTLVAMKLERYHL